MARYFFDHSVGESITLDEMGQICRDDQAAVRTGRLHIARMMSIDESILRWQHFELIIRREDGLHVGRIGMTVVTETQLAAGAMLFNKTDGHAS